jgi:hypothetical protein
LPPPRAIDRDFRNGYVAIDFPIEPIQSPIRILTRSLRLFFENLQFLAAVTLAVFLPGKLLLQAACAAFDIPADGVLAYVLMSVSDLFLAALVAPAILYGMAQRLRAGRPASFADSLRWGRRQYVRALWNMFQVQVTVLLWSLLVFIPGIIAAVRLSMVDPIVALEADRESDPLNRSRDLTQGHRWSIFAVGFPLAILDLVLSFVVLNAVEKAAYSRVLLAFADTLLALTSQWLNIALLLIYLPLAAPAERLR